MQPFPWKAWIVIALMRFSEPLVFTSLFPYVYFFVRDFGVAPTKDMIPFYTGILALVFLVGQFLFSIHWGKLSDKVGRKPVLLTALLGVSTMMIVFGTAPNFYVAAGARFIMGCFNGNVGIYRTALGELVTERSLQARAFMVVPMMWNLGVIVGPLIGGSKYLTRPKTDVSINALRATTYDEFLDKHPYLMSNVVVSVLLLILVVIGFLFFEETNEKVKHKRDIGVEWGDSILRSLGFNVKKRGHSKLDTESEPLLANDSILTTISDEPKEPMFNSKTIPVMVAYLLLCFQNVVFSEFFPVLLATPMELDNKFPEKMTGGFGFSSDKIANINSSTGFIGFLAIFLFPYLDGKFGVLNFRIALIVVSCITSTIPFLIFFTPEYSDYPPYVSKTMIYAVALIYQFTSSIAFPLITLLVHRSAPEQHKGIINSLALTLGSLSRFLGPSCWGYLTSVFQSIGYGSASWFIYSSISFIAFIQSWYIDVE